MVRKLALPAIALLVVFTSSASAQGGRGAAQNQTVNPEVIKLAQSSDLAIRNLGFTALGEVTFELINRGDVPINPMAKGGSSGPPIAVVVNVGTATINLSQPALGGKGTRTFVVPLPTTVSKPKCLEAKDVKVTVDPANQITELYDDNNVAQGSPARPCPDLAIHDIDTVKEGELGTTYRVRVTVINKGNAPSPQNQVWATALTSAPGITGWPEFSPTKTLPVLQPGQKDSFYVGGSILATEESVWVRIILDRFFHIDESDEGNNFKEKKL